MTLGHAAFAYVYSVRDPHGECIELYGQIRNQRHRVQTCQGKWWRNCAAVGGQEHVYILYRAGHRYSRSYIMFSFTN